MRTIRRARHERGASAVEFALVMPLFFLFLFGIIAFGLVFAQKLALGNAAREGARFGVVGDRTCAEIREAAQSASNTINLDGAATAVTVRRGTAEDAATTVCATPADDDTIPCAGSVSGDSIFVRVRYDSELIIPVPTFGLVADPLPIDGQGVFRCEFT